MNRAWLAPKALGALAAILLTPMSGGHVGAQPSSPAPAARVQPIAWPDEVSGKNFPLLAILDADPSARRALAAAPELRRLLEARRSAAAEATAACAAVAACHAHAFALSDRDVSSVRTALEALTTSGGLRSAIATMRRSGLFVRDAALDDAAFIGRAWERTAAGLNNVLAVYGRGERPRYPAIDAVSHDAASAGYGQIVHTAVGLMNERAGEWELFYEPTRAFALRLLELNWRDEAGRHEPMHLNENAAAFRRVASITWTDYPYTVALVPGAGLSDEMEKRGQALSPMGKLIIEIAARRYHEKKVAFIIVSGGYVHPMHSRFAEAIEMKKALMREFDVPEAAIIIDPHARHTTTNVRNAARLIFRYGIPPDRPALITTQQYHLDSIAAIGFDDRNDRELGYRPYVSKQRLSRFELEWRPNITSLQADPLDPLDP